MADLGIRDFDVAEYLDTVEGIGIYLTDILDSADPAVIVRGLSAVARSKAMETVAVASGYSREQLQHDLDSGQLLLAMIKVFDAVDLRLVAGAKQAPPVPTFDAGDFDDKEVEPAPEPTEALREAFARHKAHIISR